MSRETTITSESGVPLAPGRPVAGRLFQIVLLAALFLTYPLALLCPVTVGPPLVFYWALPWFFLLSCLAGILLLLDLPRGSLHWADSTTGRRRDLRVSPLWLLLIPVACVLSSRLTHAASSVPALELAGYFLVPGFIALAAPAFLPVRLPAVLGTLWFLSAGHGLWQYHVGFEVVGLAGNRNWMATLTVALLPWALALVGARTAGGWEQLRAGSTASCATTSAPGDWRVRLTGWLPAGWCRRGAVVGILAVSLFLAWQAESRATWLVVAGYGLLWLFPLRLPRKLFWGGALAGLCLTAACLAMHTEALRRAVNQDIRLPLWSGTAKLIAAHALGGVGPGNFRREYPAFKSTAHKMRDVAAAVTEHPHNELLHVAAVSGIPLALLWLLTLVPLLRPGNGPPVLAAVHFSAWMVFGHAVFDKTLVQPPTAVLGFLMLGLLWRVRLAPAATGQPEPCARSVYGIGLALVLGAVCLGTVPIVQSSWFLRQGMIAEEAGRREDTFKGLALAARLQTTDVQAATMAGIAANHALRNPQLALPYLERAVALERDYAHVNGELGSILGQLGQDGAALPFFEREVGLFPLDPLALRQALYCRIANQAGYRDWVADLAHLTILDRHLAEHRLTVPAVAAAVREFCLGLRQGEPERATAAARQLTSTRVHAWVTDPLYATLAAASAGIAPDPLAPFGEADLPYWQELFRLRTVAMSTCPRGTFDAVTVQTLLAQPDGARVLQILGWDTVRLRTPGSSDWRVAFLSDGVTDLFFCRDPLLLADAAAELPPALNAVLQTLAGDAAGGGELAAEWRVDLLECCARTQILTNILASAFPASSALRTGLVPSVQAFVLRQRLEWAWVRGVPTPCRVAWRVAASAVPAKPELER